MDRKTNISPQTSRRFGAEAKEALHIVNAKCTTQQACPEGRHITKFLRRVPVNTHVVTNGSLNETTKAKLNTTSRHSCSSVAGM